MPISLISFALLAAIRKISGWGLGYLYLDRFSVHCNGAYRMLLELAPGWSMDLDRGPDWLFVRLRPPATGPNVEFDLAEQVWEKLNQAFCYRLVLELDEVPRLQSWMIGQLVLLHKRICTHGGMMRLCGLNDANHQVLRICRLDDRFPQYANRTAAVMGHRPTKPR